MKKTLLLALTLVSLSQIQAAQQPTTLESLKQAWTQVSDIWNAAKGQAGDWLETKKQEYKGDVAAIKAELQAEIAKQKNIIIYGTAAESTVARQKLDDLQAKLDKLSGVKEAAGKVAEKAKDYAAQAQDYATEIADAFKRWMGSDAAQSN